MKPDARVLNATSTLEGQKIKMTIDDSALAHIMSVLTDLYSDPEMAIIREYSTNALDSHIEAGVSMPIEVQTPSALSPFFRVRDYGVGLDAEDIENIYSRYGTSTKRESNDVVGMLGLGCKSALTYTDQFTLTGIKNGIATTVSISRTEDGGGSMTIVDTYKTEDASGVEVVIPAKAANWIKNKAHTFFSYWKPGTVLVDGIEPKYILDQPDTVKVDDDLYLVRNLSSGQIVMGNVPYPVSKFRSYKVGNMLNMVAFVEIGTVQFTPSRESLQSTAKTNAAIDALIQRFDQKLAASLQANIDAKETRLEAVSEFLKAAAVLNTIDPVYRGEEIPLKIKLPVLKTYANIQAIPADMQVGNHFEYTGGNLVTLYKGRFHGINVPKRWGDSGYDYGSLNINAYSNAAGFITGFVGKTVTPTRHKKFEQFLTKKTGQDISQEYPNRFFLMKEMPKELLPWIDPAKIYKWEDIDAEVLPKKNVVLKNGRASGSYDVILENEKGVPTQKHMSAVDIQAQESNGMTIMYHVGNYHSFSHTGHVYLNNAIVVYFPQNRVNKFRRDFPNSKEAITTCRTISTTWWKNLSWQERIHLTLNKDRYLSRVSVLDPEKIKKGMKLRDLIECTKLKNSAALRDSFKQHARFIFLDTEMREIDAIIYEYPLLRDSLDYATLKRRSLEHMYKYIDAVHGS